jgi:hypothetical protein
MALSANEIKMRMLAKETTFSELARRWNTTPQILYRVVYRRGQFVYPDVRKRLARFLGVPISEIGREPQKQVKKAA